MDTFASTRSLVAKGFNPARGIAKLREEGRERYLTPRQSSGPAKSPGYLACQRRRNFPSAGRSKSASLLNACIACDPPPQRHPPSKPPPIPQENHSRVGVFRQPGSCVILKAACRRLPVHPSIAAGQGTFDEPRRDRFDSRTSMSPGTKRDWANTHRRRSREPGLALRQLLGRIADGRRWGRTIEVDPTRNLSASLRLSNTLWLKKINSKNQRALVRVGRWGAAVRFILLSFQLLGGSPMFWSN